MRNLLALPTRAGGLGIINPVHPVLQATSQYQTSIKVTCPLVELILSQTSYETVVELLEIKSELRRVKKEELTLAVDLVSDDLPVPLERASEKGASSWLSDSRAWLLPTQRSFS